MKQVHNKLFVTKFKNKTRAEKMSVELYYICLYGLLIIATTLIQQLTSIANVGLMPVFSSREGVKFSGMTARLERAILNCVVSLAMIAPAISVLTMTETSSANIVLAVKVFFWARVVYIIAYGLNVMGVRSASWVTSLLSILYLYFSAMTIS